MKIFADSDEEGVSCFKSLLFSLEYTKTEDGVLMPMVVTAYTETLYRTPAVRPGTVQKERTSGSALLFISFVFTYISNVIHFS